MNESRDSKFLFVIWSAAREWLPQIEESVGKTFKVLRSFDVVWPQRYFVKNLAAFYGWKSWHVWRNKARKCGTGPFRVVVVEDPAPVWKLERDTFGHVMEVDENVYRLKRSFRELTGRSNVVHSSVTVEETAHQLAALEAPRNDPIPFRKMIYEDDMRIRAGHRRVWLGLISDVLVPLLTSLVAGAAVWIDLFVFRTGCAEGGLVEWSGFALSAASGALMVACAISMKSGRGAHALFAAIFFDLAVREADHYLDRIFCANVWPWVLTAITVAFVGITIRYAKTVYSGVKSMRRSRLFPLFACGIALLVFVSQILGRSEVWQSLGVSDSVRFSHFVEESVELFGYALMFVWAVSHTARFMRRKHRSLRDVV